MIKMKYPQGIINQTPIPYHNSVTTQHSIQEELHVGRYPLTHPLHWFPFPQRYGREGEGNWASERLIKGVWWMFLSLGYPRLLG